jgi:myosin-3
MKQVIALSAVHSGQGLASGGGLEEKIIALNPLLEAFGNAQTLMNDNSSRFGKFIELRFNEQLIVEGALTTEYLLEKPRVVSQSDGERNFHVFYLIFAGLDDSKRKTFALQDPSEHRYIQNNSNAIAEISSAKSAEMSKELWDCFNQVGFTEQETNDLYHLLSGVLHAGDIEFDGEDISRVSNMGKLETMCEQVGANSEFLAKGLSSLSTVTRGETIVKAYKEYEAGGVRDSMAKALYGRAFSWVVKRVNSLLGPPTPKQRPTDKSISILDIFGFESFEKNQFEQLLINLANENLQYFFNNHIFKMELDEYAKEGIDGSKITYEDNQSLLDMILNKPVGLLAICDEEAIMPKGSDASMVEKFASVIGKAYPKNYVAPRGNEVIFSVNHYAGQVTYQGVGFLERNRDSLPVDVSVVLRMSTNVLVAQLFGFVEDKKKKKEQSFEATMTDLKKDMEKSKKTTVGFEFKQSLALLMTEMTAAQPHFIRCIKPNLKKIPNDYNDEQITKQLRYTGMLETTRIRKEGYSSRPAYADFIGRYKMIGFPMMANPAGTAANCAVICDKAKLADWQVGKTKVFLRYFHVDQLNKCLQPFPNAAMQVQRYAKMFAGKKKYAKMAAAAAKVRKAVKDASDKAESLLNVVFSVMETLQEEDAKRSPEAFKKKKPAKVVVDKAMEKLKQEIATSGGVATREQSVRWFKEVEMKKGAGMGADKSFQEWFHGILTRVQSEELLADKEPGTFLVRVSESRFGYSLSHVVVAKGRVKHYMIDQTPDGQYQVVGNRKLFPTLNSLVHYHGTHLIVATDPVCLVHPCGQLKTHTDTEELVDAKTKKEIEKLKKKRKQSMKK